MTQKSTKPKQPARYNEGVPLAPWRERLNEIIFGSETRMGRAFDIVLIICILVSVILVMMDSVEQFQRQHAQLLLWAEWLFTALFTLEYVLRLVSVRKPWRYCRSFFGIVDLLSILPTYLGLLLPNVKYIMVIRTLRLLRIFRVLKLSAYMEEAQVLMLAMTNSARKILVFLYAVIALVVIFGGIMYVVESTNPGFTSIPRAVYWAVVTLTTVGYGDISPQTPLGQFIAAAVMIMGYAIIAVPTGIYGAELVKSYKDVYVRNDACPDCGATGHDHDADYCKYCGHQLNARAEKH